MNNKDDAMTSTSTSTTTDRLYETFMMVLGDPDVLKLRETNPKFRYASIVEAAIALASQPNRVYL